MNSRVPPQIDSAPGTPSHPPVDEDVSRAPTSSWLAGLVGSDIAMILFFISIFYLHRVIDARNYKEMLLLWMAIVIPTFSVAALVGAFGLSEMTGTASQIIVLSGAVLLSALIVSLDREGYLAVHVFKLKRISSFRPLIGGLLFLGVGIYLIVQDQFSSRYQFWSCMTGSLLAFFISAYLFNNTYLLITKKGAIK